MVNVQGDLPLIEPRTIEQVVEPLLSDDSLVMSTVCVPMDADEQYRNPHVVKVVRDRSGNAVYFSRAPIPHFRDTGPHEAKVFKHLGLYGYRRDFLLTFAALPQTPLEQAESLEQLRALEHGYRIRVVESDCESIEIDTPEDLERARRMFVAPKERREGVPVDNARTRNEVA
jgi:3-deoxy-manno-octulosonate cytidylyltransferase (CMP-KDO synthetase)